MWALRDAFGIPDGVAWLDAAARSPMPAPVAAAMAAGLAQARVPWQQVAGQDAAGQARSLAAELVGCASQDVAIVGSVAAGMAVAARNIPIALGARILVLAGEHPSAFLAWERVAQERGAVLDVVPTPLDSDWTAAVEQRLHAPGSPPVALASLCQVHWSQGCCLDLTRIAGALRRHGAALVVDATQSAGILPIDIGAFTPDYLMFSTYKWLGGPYGLAFLYVAPNRQAGLPLEDTMLGRAGLTMADSVPGSKPYRTDAARFDRGQRDDWVAVPGAVAALRFARDWRAQGALEHIGALMGRLRERLAEQGLAVPPLAQASPHIVCIQPKAASASAVVRTLAENAVHVSARHGLVRVSLHAYCTARDVDHFVQHMRQL